MSGDAVLVVADTLRQHEPVWAHKIDMIVRCDCGYGHDIAGYDNDAHDAHVAAAVVDALEALVPCESQPCDVLVLRGGPINLCPKHRAEFDAWVAEQRGIAESDEMGRWVLGWVREPAEEGGQ